jgi:mannose-6-phosphate isomerase-like protein (cupin superfamily)
VKRIVTGVNSAGRSYIVSNEPIDDGGFTRIWEVDPKQIRDWIRGIDPAQAAASIEPPPGSSRWVIATLPPEAQDRERRRENPVQGLDEHGFHTTRTVDYDLVLQGPLVLIVDEGSVELQTGDLVVQQATRHAWRNPGKEPAKLLAVLTTVP